MSLSARLQAQERPSGSALMAALARTQTRYPVLQALALVLILAYGAATIAGFASRLSLYSMLVLASFLGLASVGQTVLVLLGAFDLSVPGFILLGATMVVWLPASGWPFAAALVLAMVFGLAGGAVNGLICHLFKVQSLIVTLATSTIVAGAVAAWTGGFLKGQAPPWLTGLVSPAESTFGIAFPPLALIWAVVAVVAGFLLHRTVPGRWVYATGANLRAADLSLVKTRRVWVASFALSALFSVLVGVLLAGFAAGDQTVGDPYLFESLTAVIVGGTAFGARGDYWRTVLGALLLTALTTVLVGHGVSTAGQDVLYGIILLVVVGAYGRNRPVRDHI